MLTYHITSLGNSKKVTPNRELIQAMKLPVESTLGTITLGHINLPSSRWSPENPKHELM